MFACLDAPLPAAPSPQPADSRAARLAKFKREQLIVDFLNRGVSVAEIAAQIGVGEKRMRVVIREILARRMPQPPEEFVAIQVSRLNEALLVAYGAMSGTNLRAVDQVVKIVRELDRYHGLSAVAGRRRREPDRLAAPAEGTAAYGGALVCRAELALPDVEDLAFAQEAQNPLAAPERGEGWPPAVDARPQIPAQTLGKIESAPEPAEAVAPPRAAVIASDPRTSILTSIRGDAASQQNGECPTASGSPRPSGARDDVEDRAVGRRMPAPPRPDARPQIPAQTLGKIESAPGQIAPSPAAKDPLDLPGLLTRGSRRDGRTSLLPVVGYGMHTSPAALCRHAPRLEGGFLPPCGGGSRRGVAPNSDSSEPFQRQMRSERDPPPYPAPTRGAGTPAAVERSPTAKRCVHPVAVVGEKGQLPARDARPEIAPQRLERIDSAPGKGEPSDLAPPSAPDLPVVRVAVPNSDRRQVRERPDVAERHGGGMKAPRSGKRHRPD